MIETRRLTPELRVQLKSPLGELIRGSAAETMKKLKKIIEQQQPPRIISVGDVVSKNMIHHNLSPQILIVDNTVMRDPIPPVDLKVHHTLHLKNLPGTLTDDAWSVIDLAMKHDQPTRILVDGEEDLLTLVAVLCAPNRSLVVYGQPHEGIVVVNVNRQNKERIKRIITQMTFDPLSSSDRVKEEDEP